MVQLMPQHTKTPLSLASFISRLDLIYSGTGLPRLGCPGKEAVKWVYYYYCCCCGWLGSRVVSVLDSGAEGPGFKSQSRRCRVTVFGKLFTPIVPLFTKQQNW